MFESIDEKNYLLFKWKISINCILNGATVCQEAVILFKMSTNKLP